MYQIEIHNRIRQNVGIFNKFGMWRNEDDLTIFRKMGRKLLYLIFHVCYVVSLAAGALSSDDRNDSVYLIAATIATFVVSVKLFYILWKKEEIGAFIHDIGTHSIDDNENFVEMNDKLKNLMKLSSCLTLTTAVIIGVIILSTLPIFTSEKKLPLNIWFPLDWKNNEIGYWMVFTFVSTGLIVTAVVVTLNVVIWYLMMNCAIKYQILGNQFRNIGSKKPIVKNQNISEVREQTNIVLTKPIAEKREILEVEKQILFLEELIELIKIHRNIQETIDRFKSCFANLFFTQITTSGICICGSVYGLVFDNHHENRIQAAVNVGFLLHNIFDIFMVMYLGNEIRLSSDRLSYCLFESNWIEQSKSCKKCIIILTEVLKQPQELVIGKLYPLTLETFTSILNLAYSMFNILQNLN